MLVKSGREAIHMDERNKKLLQENQEQQHEIELLTAENDRLSNNTQQQFMLAGGGILIAGIFVGTIFSRLKTSRSDSWV